MIDTGSNGWPGVRPTTARGLVRADAERLAVAATAAAIALLPLLRPGGPANIAPVDLLIALALWSCVIWAGASLHPLRFPYAAPVALLLVGGALGAMVGPVPVAGIIAVVQDLVLLAWCWAVVNISSTPRRFEILAWTWALSSIGWAGLLFVGLATGSTALTGQVAEEASRTALTLGDPSYSASYYFVSLMVIWATGYPRSRVARLAAYALLVAALFTTGSNSGSVSLMIGVAVAGLLAVHRRHGPVPAVAATAMVVVCASVFFSAISFQEIRESARDSRWAFVRDGIGRSEVSGSQRSILLAESARLYATGGPLGQGPVSTKPRLEAEMITFAKEAHNDYIAALIERGAIGLAGVFFLVAALLLRARCLLGAGLAEGWSRVVVRPNALAGAVAGTLVASTVYELLHVRHVWALFGLVAALAIWGRR